MHRSISVGDPGPKGGFPAPGLLIAGPGFVESLGRVVGCPTSDGSPPLASDIPSRSRRSSEDVERRAVLDALVGYQRLLSQYT